VQWTAPLDARSFLVRVNPIPFTGMTGEMVVGGEARTLTLTGLSLASGGQYQAVVFAFSKDVRRRATWTVNSTLARTASRSRRHNLLILHKR